MWNAWVEEQVATPLAVAAILSVAALMPEVATASAVEFAKRSADARKVIEIAFVMAFSRYSAAVTVVAAVD